MLLFICDYVVIDLLIVARLLISITIDRVALILNQFLTSLSQAKTEHLVIKVSLHVLVSFLEFSDHNFLPWIEVCRICSVSLIQICGVRSLPSASHALHIEDGVWVDYRDYWNYNQARASRDQQWHVLTSPSVKYNDEETRKDSEFHSEKDDVLLLVVHDTKLLVIRKAKDREQAVENTGCVTMFFFLLIKPFIDDLIFLYLR